MNHEPCINYLQKKAPDVFWCLQKDTVSPLCPHRNGPNFYVSACCFVLQGVRICMCLCQILWTWKLLQGKGHVYTAGSVLRGNPSLTRGEAGNWFGGRSQCVNFKLGNFKRWFSILRFIIDVSFIFQMKQDGSSLILRDFVSCCQGLVKSWFQRFCPWSLDDRNFCSAFLCEARSGKHLQNEVDIKK